MNIVVTEPTKQAFNRTVVTINNWANGVAASLLEKVQDIDTKEIIAKVLELQAMTTELLKKVSLSNVLILNWGKDITEAEKPDKDSVPRSASKNVVTITQEPIRLGTNINWQEDDEEELLKAVNTMLRSIYNSLKKYLDSLSNDADTLGIKVPFILEGLDLAIDIINQMSTTEDYIQQSFQQALGKDDDYIKSYEDYVATNSTFTEAEIPAFRVLPETNAGSFSSWCTANNVTPGSLPSGKYPFTFSNLTLPTSNGTFTFSGQGSFDVTEEKMYTKPEALPKRQDYGNNQYVYLYRYSGYLQGTGTFSSTMSATFTGRSGSAMSTTNADASFSDFISNVLATENGKKKDTIEIDSINAQISFIQEKGGKWSLHDKWKTAIQGSIGAIGGGLFGNLRT